MSGHGNGAGPDRDATQEAGPGCDDPSGSGARSAPDAAETGRSNSTTVSEGAGPEGAGQGAGQGAGPEGDVSGVAAPPAPAATELEVLRRERDEYLDMVRRVQADFENYKKRMLRQQTEQLERAAENLVSHLLPALDAFDLARAHLGDAAAGSSEVQSLLQASALLVDTLTKEGLERVADAGVPFDPVTHDAVEHAPAADTVAGTGAEAAPPTAPVVADVLRSGYRWKGRLIRPAMVRVRG